MGGARSSETRGNCRNRPGMKNREEFFCPVGLFDAAMDCQGKEEMPPIVILSPSIAQSAEYGVGGGCRHTTEEQRCHLTWPQIPEGAVRMVTLVYAPIARDLRQPHTSRRSVGRPAERATLWLAWAKVGSQTDGRLGRAHCGVLLRQRRSIYQRRKGIQDVRTCEMFRCYFTPGQD